MSTTGISAGEISIYTVLIRRNLWSFKAKHKQKNPNLSGSWLGSCEFEIRVFPWVLDAYFGAGRCFGRTPRLGSGGAMG